ncbi:hypothetical protein PVAG01_04370 [Phlyctema vagabunda]|uniref:Uncharacterized protein n=1 Tax=Phlyctema vagabunda TaxID=108571 RepID=A0ABR4PP57_9HELO
MVGTQKYTDEEVNYILSEKARGVRTEDILHACQARWGDLRDWHFNGVRYVCTSYKDNPKYAAAAQGLRTKGPVQSKKKNSKARKSYFSDEEDDDDDYEALDTAADAESDFEEDEPPTAGHSLKTESSSTYDMSAPIANKTHNASAKPQSHKREASTSPYQRPRNANEAAEMNGKSGNIIHTNKRLRADSMGDPYLKGGAQRHIFSGKLPIGYGNPESAYEQERLKQVSDLQRQNILKNSPSTFHVKGNSATVYDTSQQSRVWGPQIPDQSARLTFSPPGSSPTQHISRAAPILPDYTSPTQSNRVDLPANNLGIWIGNQFFPITSFDPAQAGMMAQPTDKNELSPAASGASMPQSSIVFGQTNFPAQTAPLPSTPLQFSGFNLPNQTQDELRCAPVSTYSATTGASVGANVESPNESALFAPFSPDSFAGPIVSNAGYEGNATNNGTEDDVFQYIDLARLSEDTAEATQSFTPSCDPSSAEHDNDEQGLTPLQRTKPKDLIIEIPATIPYSEPTTDDILNYQTRWEPLSQPPQPPQTPAGPVFPFPPLPTIEGYSSAMFAHTDKRKQRQEFYNKCGYPYAKDAEREAYRELSDRLSHAISQQAYVNPTDHKSMHVRVSEEFDAGEPRLMLSITSGQTKGYLRRMTGPSYADLVLNAPQDEDEQGIFREHIELFSRP